MNFNAYNKKFFTSDTHFGHANIMKWCPKTRPWKSVDEMNDGIIQKWNSIVSPDDVTFLLGDVTFMNQDSSVEIIRALNGDIVLVPGNHDHKNMKNPHFRSRFIIHKELLEVDLIVPNPTVRQEKQKVVMCHFPIWEWNQIGRGAFHLHGHCHGKSTDVPGRIMDVGWDAHDKGILEWKDVYDQLIVKPVRSH